ncbi:META domain-containing protein [Ignatzschineria sp. LJL83]
MKKLLLSSVALLVIAACSGKGNIMTQQDTKIPTVVDLQHHNYELTAINGKEFETADGSLSPHIAFGEDMNINGEMCNNFFGKAQLTARGVIRATGMGMTRKFCSDSTLNNLDGDIVELLDNGAEIIMSNNGQYIRISNTRISLEFKLADKM